MSIDWAKYKNFTAQEFACKETGEHGISADFMDKLQALRAEYGRSMTITSGYRSPRHSIERAKALPGTHAQGIACDVACIGVDKYDLVALAIKHGFNGIGVANNFIHLDTRDHGKRAIWIY